MRDDGPVRNVAVLLAGGTGSRVGAGIPKQLIEVAGRPLLEHSLATFHEHPDIDEVVVVMAESHLGEARALTSSYAKVKRVLPGGASRSDSTLAALAVLDDDDLVLLHDAARPLVTRRIVDDCLAALADHEAVGTVVESADTIWQVDDRGRLAAIPPRDSLRRVQTPQGFRVGALRTAYAKAALDPGFAATDDCAVVFRYTPEVRIALVAGDVRNLKVTQPSDLLLVERLLG